MPNIPLAYVSVYRRMSDIFHTLTYACTIRNSVTGPLARQHTILDIHLCPVSLAELCIVDVNRDLFKIWMSVGKPGGHGG